MPIYEYECSSCGERLESFQKISDPPLIDCPACGQPTLRKLVSVAAFHLKGSGWYATDFKEKPRNRESTNDSSNERDDKPATPAESPAGDAAKTEPAGSAGPGKPTSMKKQAG